MLRAIYLEMSCNSHSPDNLICQYEERSLSPLSPLSPCVCVCWVLILDKYVQLAYGTTQVLVITWSQTGLLAKYFHREMRIRHLKYCDEQKEIVMFCLFSLQCVRKKGWEEVTGSDDCCSLSLTLSLRQAVWYLIYEAVWTSKWSLGTGSVCVTLFRPQGVTTLFASGVHKELW